MTEEGIEKAVADLPTEKFQSFVREILQHAWKTSFHGDPFRGFLSEKERKVAREVGEYLFASLMEMKRELEGDSHLTQEPVSPQSSP